MIFGMAEPSKKQSCGEDVGCGCTHRSGELLPGMAYLVRVSWKTPQTNRSYGKNS
jgi:hypothetical protein